MEVQILERNTEQIIEQGKVTEIMGIKSNKTLKSYVQSKINHFFKFPETMYSGKEIEMILRGILEASEYYQDKPIIGKVQIDTWHGKSGIIKLIKKPDMIIAYKMQKPSKNEEPIEIQYKVTKDQFNALIMAINRVNKEVIDTTEIAENWVKILGISKNKKGMPLFWSDGRFIWDNFFAWRKAHNNLTVALNILASKNIIEYTGGKTKVLSRDYSFDKL